MLVALSPDNPWEFLTAMAQAWEWTQARPRFYCDTGGNQTFDAYLTNARQPDHKQLAVQHAGAMVSLITVRCFAEGCYEIHVTSQRGAPADVIRDALLTVRDGLFHDLGAQTILTTCPVYGTHEHTGSRRLAEACGMTPNGQTRQSGGATWREYELTKEQFYGKPKASHNERERVSVLPKAFLARTGRPQKMEPAGRPVHRRELWPAEE